MPLNDIAIKKAKPGITPRGTVTTKPYTMTDSGGLYLEVAPSGGKWWRFKYRFSDKQKRISLGVYPDVPLKKARERRDEARRLLADGVDPGENRKAMQAAGADRAANSFEVVAREWFAKYEPSWAASHSSKTIRRLEVDVFPWLGARPIAEITPKEVLSCLQRIVARGARDTSHRALQNCGQVFRYAVVTGRTDRNPAGDLRGALPPSKHEHFAAITEPIAVGELLRLI